MGGPRTDTSTSMKLLIVTQPIDINDPVLGFLPLGGGIR